MKKLILHIKLWNSWRKRSGNGKFHKLLVLFGIIKSPTFIREVSYEKIRNNM